MFSIQSVNDSDFSEINLPKSAHEGDKIGYKYIFNNLDNYVEVKDYKLSEKTNKWDKTLYCLITDNHQIPIGEYTFWDWED